VLAGQPLLRERKRSPNFDRVADINQRLAGLHLPYGARLCTSDLGPDEVERDALELIASGRARVIQDSVPNMYRNSEYIKHDITASISKQDIAQHIRSIVFPPHGYHRVTPVTRGTGTPSLTGSAARRCHTGSQDGIPSGDSVRPHIAPRVPAIE
jgi:hypothetical protein